MFMLRLVLIQLNQPKTKVLFPDGHTDFKVLKLLSEDPSNYENAPREGIRRILNDVVSTWSRLTIVLGNQHKHRTEGEDSHQKHRMDKDGNHCGD